MLPLLLDAVAEGPLTPLVSLGVGGAIAWLVLSQARQDRKESQERWAALATDFKKIIQENTEAMVALSGKVENSPDRCAVAEMLVEIIKSGKPINLEP